MTDSDRSVFTDATGTVQPPATTPDKPVLIGQHRDPVVKESVGPQWHESRDFWRVELLKHFPEPSKESPNVE